MSQKSTFAINKNQMKKSILLTFTLLISSLLFSQTGLIGSYPFNSNANDVSGFGNNGVINGATLTTDRFGSINSAYSFNGISDYIDLGLNYSYSSHTFSAWVKMNNLPSERADIISKLNNGIYDTKNSEYSVNGTKRIEVVVGTGTTWEGIYTTDSINLNSWYLLTYTYNAVDDKAKVYKNNILLDSAIISSYVDVVNTPVYVGARPYWGGTGSTTFYFSGAIDDINIYNIAISQSVVDSLYNFNPTTNINNIISNTSFNVYPNPSSSTFSILGIDEKDFQYIEVSDLTGRLILKTTNYTNIDLSNFDKGVYIYKVLGDNCYTGKIMKK